MVNASIATEHKEYISRPKGTEFVHASTNLCLKDSSILLAWFSGSIEGNDDVKIYYSRKENGVWSSPISIEDNIKAPHWNPVLFSLTNETIILFYKVGKKIHEWQTYFCTSEDNGLTFSQPKQLVEGDIGGRGPVRNKPIRLSNNDIVAPASQESGIWNAFVDISSDQGKTWEKSTSISIKDLTFSVDDVEITESHKKIPVSEQSFYGRGVIQPTLWESTPGNVHMLLRSSEGHIYRSDSSDFGKTWSHAYQTTLPNNNSGIDLVKLENGVLFLVFNPVKKNWGERSPISLARSINNGTTWETLMNLDSGEGEYSYPAITSSKNKLFISYSFKRESVAFWEIELKTNIRNISDKI